MNNDERQNLSLPSPVALDPVYIAFIAESQKVANEEPFFTWNHDSETDGIIVQKIRNDEELTYGTQKLPAVIEEDKTIVYNNTEVRLTFLRPLGTEKEILPAVIF